jgi:LuxR family transcriptional regulator, maltose regulon positive regulatory protein
MSDASQILLQTKLRRPPIANGLIDRPNLLERLNTGIHCPLTLVLASAGFGKTTLVSTWLERMAVGQGGQAAALPSAWLSLDETDSDLYLFLRYSIAALRTIFKEACEETLALLNAPLRPPQTFIYATFSNELEQLPGEAILVLDDYHTIRGMEVHNLLIELVRHWPKSLHLVLISRINPPLPLDNLRAKGQLSEIRASELRFTQREIVDYLNREQVGHLSQDALPILEERFEGWPAGLHLAALSLRFEGSGETVLSILSAENANITGYLADEVLNHQLPAIQTFLLKTSILDRFCVSLCEAVIGESDPAWNARLCLDWIERSELFLVPLDQHRQWYRYHHLFQSLLQQRLSAELAPDQVASLHRLASGWFEEHGLMDEALHHALAAGDLELVARQMSAGLRDLLNREDHRTLERRLRLLPQEMIQQRPELLIIRAWILELTWQLNLQAQIIHQAEILLDSETAVSLPANDLQIQRGQILQLKTKFAYFSNQTTRAIDLSRQALALMPPAWTFVRGAAMLYMCLAMQADGQADAAERLLLDEFGSCVDKTAIYPLILLQTLGYIYLWTGQLVKAKQIGQMLIQEATASRIIIMKNWGDYYLGVACYQCNELETADQYFTQISNNRFYAHGSAYSDAVAGLVLIHQHKGERAEAWRMVESISQFDLQQRGSEDERTSSLRARLMLLEGDLEGAGRWADSFTDLPPDLAILWLEEPQVTRARILVARGSEVDLRLARQILDVLYEIAERTHNTRLKIEILALRALALNAQGETSAANLELEQAVKLARPGGFIRVFVDLGQPMQRLLHRLAKQEHSAETIRRLLAAFSDADENSGRSTRPALPVRHPSPGNSTLFERLTPRELEVLILLREPLSIKEIALKLNISYTTAKRHTINIYAKLGVNQRYKAVARAIELGILPPE